jgi:UDP-2,3-diacylglucosamine hydrolase
MTTLIISDLHLDDDRPRSTALFEKFIKTEAKRSDALYILGDLFEYWLGDDVRSETSMRVSRALASLAGTGIPCYFMHGNRDFLLGRRYAAQSGIQLLPEELVVDFYGTPTLLMHGDSLCTDDVVYQEVRRKIRSKDWRKAFLSSSPDERNAFVRDARTKSRAHQLSVSMDIMDVNQDSVDRAFEHHGVTELVHGHTHRPAVHKQQLNGGSTRRIVLGDWYEQGSVLRVSSAHSELTTF